MASFFCFFHFDRAQRSGEISKSDEVKFNELRFLLRRHEGLPELTK